MKNTQKKLILAVILALLVSAGVAKAEGCGDAEEIITYKCTARTDGQGSRTKVKFFEVVTPRQEQQMENWIITQQDKHDDVYCNVIARQCGN